MTLQSTEPQGTLRKEFELTGIRKHLPDLADRSFWQRLVPGARISDEPFEAPSPSRVSAEDIAGWRDQLRNDAYCQTIPLIDERRCAEMIRCIEGVRAVGLPATFALVYDVFFTVFADLDAMLRGVFGVGYRILPNFWIYYIENADDDHGFEPHRDAEYANTIDDDGLPTVITLWLALTDATPLNSCMYMVPAGRDPDYAQSIHDLSAKPPGFALENIRALPAAARTVSCWTQYIYHWGSRSCQRAPAPRLSYAFYCQRDDVEPVDTVVEVPSKLHFRDRLAYACRGLHRYSYLALRDAPDSQPILDFFTAQMASVGIVALP